MFLHMLANMDAYEASALFMVSKRKKSDASKPGGSKRASTAVPPALRPKSVLDDSDRCVSAIGRPKSGRSLCFQFESTKDHTVETSGKSPPRSKAKRRSKASSSSSKQKLSNNGVTLSTGASQLCSIPEGSPTPTPEGLSGMEPAFLEVQDGRPGLTIWRVQRSSLQFVHENDFGFFHEGNAYLILNIKATTERFLHYWSGALCSEADRAFVEDKAHELDKIVGNAHVFSRECQNHESTNFLRSFSDGVIYIEGKHKTNVTKAAGYEKKLYLVNGRKYPRATGVMPSREHFQPTNTFILDGFPRIYVWIGNSCGYVQRTKAMRIARKIQQWQRKSKCHVVVIDENDVHLNEAFKKKFDGPVIPRTDTAVGQNGVDCNGVTEKEDELRLVLFRVSGDRVLYDMPEAAKRPLKHCYLVKQDSFLLDRGTDKTVYMWTGTMSSEEDVDHAITRSKSFSIHNDYPDTVPLCRLRENHEADEFKRCFCDWRDRLSKDMSIAKTYSVGNIGRALFSRTDRRTVATVKKCWSDDSVGECKGTTQMWELNDGKLHIWDHRGVFYNNKCYIILYTILDTEHPAQVLYYWMGSKSSQEDKENLIKLTYGKDDELNNTSVMVRVLDGKEPSHFMNALSNWMMVYGGELDETSELQMFCAREFLDKSMRIAQVSPKWSNLNSSASFVVLSPPASFLWYGKFSGSTERECAKDLLGVLCSSKKFDYDIVTEGKETGAFREVVGEPEPYCNEFKKPVLERRNPLMVLCENGADDGFIDIEDFAQEDLSEEDVIILDLYDQLFVWCGETVEDDTRKTTYDIAKAYIQRDPAGRQLADVALWFVSQRSEPVSFSKHFNGWNALGYSGRHLYEVLRKRIRQENAKIDLNESIVDTAFLGQPKYQYKTLVKKELPGDVDERNKHLHLTERQFRENLKVSRLEFYRLPEWKQSQVLRSARLLYTPPHPDYTLDTFNS